MATELPKGWKIISSEYLHKEDWLTVRKDKIELANGHTIPQYFVLEYPDWINTIAITKEGKFIFVKQYRHGIGKYSFELCAGVCEARDADPMESAKRELLEETGYSGGSWQKWMFFAPNPATSNNWVHCFLATDLEKTDTPSPEPSEELSVHLFSFTEVKEMLGDGTIIQATHLTPLWKYVALNGR
jgi:ADP-ribose pyrophosphatase